MHCQKTILNAFKAALDEGLFINTGLDRLRIWFAEVLAEEHLEYFHD